MAALVDDLNTNLKQQVRAWLWLAHLRSLDKAFANEVIHAVTMALAVVGDEITFILDVAVEFFERLEQFGVFGIASSSYNTSTSI